jgi:3-oxoacyl-[acyl-carrier-protein] synthase II
MSKVAVTGLGIICCLGRGIKKVWPRLLNGETRFQPISLPGFSDFVNRIGGEVSLADHSYLPSSLSRHEKFGLAAAVEALDDSGLAADMTYKSHEVGLFAGIGASAMLEAEDWLTRYHQYHTLTPGRKLHGYPASSLADFLADKYDINGSRLSVATACSSSLTSLGLASDQIKNKRIKAAVVVGAEGLSRLTYGGFHALHSIAPESCQPFDKNRKGIFLGEGGACLILEDFNHAIDRGAEIYCEIKGWGLSSDCFHMTAPHPQGDGAGRAMIQALTQAGLAPRDIGYINTHGTGTRQNDTAETNGIKTVFGDHAQNLLLSSTKSMTGHCLGAAGAIESVISVLALYHEHCPPTASLTCADPQCDLNYLPLSARKKTGLCHVMNNVLAFGGNNVSAVFSKNIRVNHD